MNHLFALRHIATWDWEDILVTVVIIAACVGITIVALRYFEITIPPWLIRIIQIVAVACVAIIAIRFVAAL